MATDYWKLCETGLITLLRTELSSYWTDATKQVTASDDQYLSAGFDHFAFTYPGAFPQTEDTSGFIEYSWEILLDLMVRWKTSETKAWNENGFKAYRGDVIYLLNHTQKGRNLGKTQFVRDAILSSEDRPSYIPVSGTEDSMVVYSHIRQVCLVTVRQIVPREGL